VDLDSVAAHSVEWYEAPGQLVKVGCAPIACPYSLHNANIPIRYNRCQSTSQRSLKTIESLVSRLPVGEPFRGD